MYWIALHEPVRALVKVPLVCVIAPPIVLRAHRASAEALLSPLLAGAHSAVLEVR